MIPLNEADSKKKKEKNIKNRRQAESEVTGKYAERSNSLH